MSARKAAPARPRAKPRAKAAPAKPRAKAATAKAASAKAASAKAASAADRKPRPKNMWIDTRSGARVSYPPGLVVRPRDCDLGELKRKYGGRLPDINGRKHTYPSPTDEAAWRRLYACAVTYRNKRKYCIDRRIPFPRDPLMYKYEYLLHHAQKNQKRDRAARNRDRKLHGLKKGDARVVHHLDPRDMTTAKSVKLTHCQHQRMHGKTCAEKRVRAARRKKKSP